MDFISIMNFLLGLHGVNVAGQLLGEEKGKL